MAQRKLETVMTAVGVNDLHLLGVGVAESFLRFEKIEQHRCRVQRNDDGNFPLRFQLLGRPARDVAPKTVADNRQIF